MPGACNDLNVLAKSSLFDELTAGRAPKIQFQVNNIIHKLGYYLADGIYPRWATFVKTIPSPTRPKEITFAKAQEGYRKDVERCFVEDERPEDSDEDLESDEEEDNNMRPRIAEVWDGHTGQDFEEVGRDAHTFEGFMEQYNEIRNQYDHSNIQEDLIEHLWEVQGNMDI
ncbi:PREDICTED: uncharacterized protein LOC101312148 [Fragaria vesca subsp. vesca]|uniref:uncharacterized protein LOC101312148 n=1 Tax=Fragaria vesca subsp. vesca TaxID=101020 RepID=UPI0002C37694|nr:PREDICTED: uncharacterized protein LOC101312148 [Fragaria vesca subsp. vesca]